MGEVYSSSYGNGDTILSWGLLFHRYVRWELDIVHLADEEQGTGRRVWTSSSFWIDLWGWDMGTAQFNTSFSRSESPNLHEVSV
ncbi:hypothetical protein LguiA_000832 [Lonicera macranthoides]